MSKLKIGVTGNIGAGKTQVCRIFELLGIAVYYADEKAKSLMIRDERLVTSIKELLGEKAFDLSGELDRQYISSIVFNNKEKLQSLNSIVHPAVAQDFVNWADQQESEYCIKEAALLFESGSYKQLDRTILVIAEERKRIERVMARDGMSEGEVRRRIDKQMKETEKRKLADFIIDNNGEIGLVTQVLDLHQTILNII